MSTESRNTRKPRLYWLALAIMLGAFVAVAVTHGAA